MSYLKKLILKMPFSDKKAILIGNTLEFFDLYLYIHFAAVISKHFFAPGFEKTTFFQSFIFCQMYLFAPIACFLFSYLGDKYGRKSIIVHTSMLMAITSILILFLPTYDTWGDYATFTIIILRIFQGIALAGEPLAANLYLAESSTIDINEPWYKQTAWYLKLAHSSEQLGGLFALIICYISLHYFDEYSQSWRIPFVFGFVFVFFVFILRIRLSESEEYAAATNNKKITIGGKFKDSYFYLRKTLFFYKRNVLCWILLLLPYPIIFNICFLHITPRIIGVDAPLESMLEHNAYLSIGCIFSNLFFAFFPLKFKWNLKITVMAYVLIGCICATVAIWMLENKVESSCLFTLQVLMMSLINFGLIMPALMKVFPVIGRYTLIGFGWSISRFIGFFIVVLGIKAICDAFGLYGCLYLLFFLISLGLFATWYHVCYYTIDDQITLKNYKESKKNGMVPGKGMTQEEIDEYLNNKKDF